MVLFAIPDPTKALQARIAELDGLRERLGDATGIGGPWLGQLRRQARATAVTSSVSIEGYHVDAAEAPGLVDGNVAPGVDEARLAVAGYARAMDHVGTMAIDPTFAWNERVILDLHFDACRFQRDRSPGLWRTGPIFVTAEGGGPPAYTGPEGGDVVELMAQVAAWLEQGDLASHVVVRAAMAHLHVVSVHPFRDGNGRLARIVQSLVLARDGVLAPEFSSIEEYLGGHTREYYAALRKVQDGRYQPQRDASSWVRFCLDAHLAQARQRLAQLEEAGRRWAALERLAEQRGWPDRLVIALEQSLFDGVEPAAYVSEADVSRATATTDLRRLVDAGLVEQRGRTRSTRYLATDALREAVT